MDSKPIGLASGAGAASLAEEGTPACAACPLENDETRRESVQGGFRHECEGYACNTTVEAGWIAGVGRKPTSRVASYGAGLTRYLLDQEEQVFEVGRPRGERRSGGKTDALDAIRAARIVLAQKRGAVPRSIGEREALRALVAAREGAAVAKQAALNQLCALLVTTPEPLRAELRALTRARLLNRLAATRPTARRDPEIRGTLRSERSRAASSSSHTKSAGSPARSTTSSADSPHSYSTSPASARCLPHRSCSQGRIEDGSRTRPPSPDSPASPRSPPHQDKRSATASTAAPTENSTAPSTSSCSPANDHTQQRSPTSNDELQEGKTRREATRCLKRYLARNLYRLLENPPATNT